MIVCTYVVFLPIKSVNVKSRYNDVGTDGKTHFLNNVKIVCVSVCVGVGVFCVCVCVNACVCLLYECACFISVRACMNVCVCLSEIFPCSVFVFSLIHGSVLCVCRFD